MRFVEIPSDCMMVLENPTHPESRAASVWAVMSDKWNGPFFSPVIRCWDLHSDYNNEIVIDDVVVKMAP